MRLNILFPISLLLEFLLRWNAYVMSVHKRKRIQVWHWISMGINACYFLCFIRTQLAIALHDVNLCAWNQGDKKDWIQTWNIHDTGQAEIKILTKYSTVQQFEV